MQIRCQLIVTMHNFVLTPAELRELMDGAILIGVSNILRQRDYAPTAEIPSGHVRFRKVYL